MLKTGMQPAEILAALAATDSAWAGRQLGIVDAHGHVATWTGPKCSDWAGGETGVDFTAQGQHPRRARGRRGHGEGVSRIERA
jgi:uncharacterized Ntn-hydrolase superfamily protein